MAALTDQPPREDWIQTLLRIVFKQASDRKYAVLLLGQGVGCIRANKSLLRLHALQQVAAGLAPHPFESPHHEAPMAKLV